MAVPAAAPDRAVPEPVDWALAARVARLTTGREQLASSYLGRSLDRDFAEVTEQAEAAVAELTGLHGPGHAHAAVVDRAGWVEANVASMRRLLRPLTDRVGHRLARSPIAPVGRTIAGTELGLLLGWVSQRVLGQYDLLVPDDDGATEGDAVYYVGANILGLEKRFAFRPRDFRLWIALHEVTHRAQFTGVPWLRPHFLGLVDEVIGLADPDPTRFVAALGRVVDELRHGRDPLGDGLVALFASPEQREVLDRVQALMSLLEGHGNAVMNRLGADLVHGQARMARVLETRREQRGVTAIVQRLLGFDLKLRQYALGESFVDAVELEAGPRAIDVVWSSPEHLPTLAELHDASAWLARVDSLRVPG